MKKKKKKKKKIYAGCFAVSLKQIYLLDSVQMIYSELSSTSQRISLNW